MKAIFITYNASLNDQVMEVLDKNSARGFTKWELTHGRGNVDGEPHYGTHAWPSTNCSILTVVTEPKAEAILKALHALDEKTPQHGLRAYTWGIEESI